MSSDSSTQSLAVQRRTSTATIAVTALLCVYWAILFYGTHATLPPGSLPGGSDKFVHFVAYAGLGFLLMIERTTRGLCSWFTVLTCWLVLMAYGVFDELTQMLVNRQADVQDWLYDAAGSATGLILVMLAVYCFRPKLRESF